MKTGVATTAEPDLTWDLRTPDLACMRREVARCLKPFRLLAQERRYDGRFLHRRLHRVQVLLIDYGGEVAIDAGRMGPCYLLQLPLQGSFRLSSSGHTVEVSTHCAHLVHPGMELRMDWTSDCRVLVFRFEESMMRCPEPAAGAIWPSPDRLLPLDLEPNRSLGRIIDYVAREASGGNLFERLPHAAAHAEDLLLASVNEAFWRIGCTAADMSAAPGYVSRAEEYILEHLDECLSVADIAAAILTPERRLFAGFQRVHGTGPLAWMRAQRLERVRAELLSSGPGQGRITDVALRWGFTHLGRFSAAYRARFGETPGSTLRGDH